MNMPLVRVIHPSPVYQSNNQVFCSAFSYTQKRVKTTFCILLGLKKARGMQVSVTVEVFHLHYLTLSANAQ